MSRFESFVTIFWINIPFLFTFFNCAVAVQMRSNVSFQHEIINFELINFLTVVLFCCYTCEFAQVLLFLYFSHGLIPLKIHLFDLVNEPVRVQMY